MVKTYGSRFSPSSNLEKVTIRFDKLIITDLFLQLNGVYIVHRWYSLTKMDVMLIRLTLSRAGNDQ